MLQLSETAVDFVAGWCSGAAGILLTQPLDSLLVRLQVSEGAVPVKAAVRSVRSPAALWRGATVMMGAVPAQNALLFAGYGAGLQWSERATQHGKTPPLWHVFIGGCAGGFAQSFLASPVELLKVRLQLQNPALAAAAVTPVPGAAAAVTAASTPRGALALALQLTRAGSSSGLTLPSAAWTVRGLSATFGRDVVPHGVWFAAYEGAKRQLSGSGGPQSDASLSAASQVAAGAFAATVAWCVGYPFDVIKTRMQAAETSNANSSSSSISSSTNGPGLIATARAMHAAEGASVFWRGLPLKLARAVPMSVVGFFVYEEVAAALRSDQQQQQQ